MISLCRHRQCLGLDEKPMLFAVEPAIAEPTFPLCEMGRNEVHDPLCLFAPKISTAKAYP
jgi:hypothetical protein